MTEQDDLRWARGLPTLYRRSAEWGEGEIFLHSENICPTGKFIPAEFVVFGPCSWAEPCQWCRERSSQTEADISRRTWAVSHPPLLLLYSPSHRQASLGRF